MMARRKALTVRKARALAYGIASQAALDALNRDWVEKAYLPGILDRALIREQLLLIFRRLARRQGSHLVPSIPGARLDEPRTHPRGAYKKS